MFDSNKIIVVNSTQSSIFGNNWYKKTVVTASYLSYCGACSW